MKKIFTVVLLLEITESTRSNMGTEQEVKLNFLRSKSKSQHQNHTITSDDPLDSTNDAPVQNSVSNDDNKHINFFADLENGAVISTKGNEKYLKEKKDEQEKYEKQIGYLTYLGQDTNESLVLMSCLFEAAILAASYAKFRPQPPHSTITRLIDYVKKGLQHDQLLKPKLAVDVGCGTGQCTSMLAEHFQTVCGFDVSVNQINYAKKTNPYNNISYEIAVGDKMPLADNSVDLVTCAQSFHWLDPVTFYPELNRILQTSGVIALITYEMPFLTLSKSQLIQPEKTDKCNINDLIRNFYRHSILKPYWTSRERYLVDTAYQSVVLPFPNQIRFQDKLINNDISASDIVGYIHSWSGFNSLKEKNPEVAKQLTEEFNYAIKKISGDLNLDCFSVEFTFHLIMAKKG